MLQRTCVGLEWVKGRQQLLYVPGEDRVAPASASKALKGIHMLEMW